MQIKSLFLIFIVLLTNCKSDKIQEINQNGYSLSYPSKLVLENNLEGVEFILFTERKSSDDEFLENINLMIQNLESMNIDLDKFVDISIDQVEQEGELISSERVKKDHTEYQRIVYTTKMHKLDLKLIQHDYVINDKAYILTFTSEESEFDNYADDMEEIMSTFNVK